MGEAWGGRADGAREFARPGGGRVFAALDLGTNNCRLLIAIRRGEGFRVIDSYSRIVRLGEGLTRTGRLGEAAMQRAMEALGVCARKIRKQGATRLRAVATQACRAATNGAEFIEKVETNTGLRLTIISPREEARLSVAGCLNLLDPASEAALVLDVGGGSTELSWIDLKALGPEPGRSRPASWRAAVKAWLSVPIGVVSLAEHFPERLGGAAISFDAMVQRFRSEIGGFAGAEPFRAVFAAGRAHLVGTSGAITSLAALHLGLARYDRARVDGLWMTRGECEAVGAQLLRLTPNERAASPCIGRDRADLVLAGAAILHAVQELWPCGRVRVADRGLREGLLLSLIADERRRTARRRTRVPAGGLWRE